VDAAHDYAIRILTMPMKKASSKKAAAYNANKQNKPGKPYKQATMPKAGKKK